MATEQRDSMIFYASFYEASKDLPDSAQLELLRAIFEYGLFDNSITLSGIPNSLFKLIKPQLDANAQRYKNGCKGGRPKNQNKTKTKPKNNQTETKTKPNYNENENVNENIKEKSVKKKSGTFVPPTLDDVSEYCRDRNNGINAQTFIDFYEARGWMAGKSKMKDWKAAVRTWENREKKNEVSQIATYDRSVNDLLLTAIDE